MVSAIWGGIINSEKQKIGGTYCVAFCPTHHLPVVQPLGGKYFIKDSKVKFSLLQEAGKLLGCVSMQQVVIAGLILHPDLSTFQVVHNRPFHPGESFPFVN